LQTLRSHLHLLCGHIFGFQVEYNNVNCVRQNARHPSVSQKLLMWRKTLLTYICISRHIILTLISAAHKRPQKQVTLPHVFRIRPTQTVLQHDAGYAPIFSCWEWRIHAFGTCNRAQISTTEPTILILVKMFCLNFTTKWKPNWWRTWAMQNYRWADLPCKSFITITAHYTMLNHKSDVPMYNYINGQQSI